VAVRADDRRAGVHLKRAFGNRETPLLDPFLLLDDFRSDDPRNTFRDSMAPAPGIETITYVLEGDVEHGTAWETGAISPPATSSG